MACADVCAMADHSFANACWLLGSLSFELGNERQSENLNEKKGRPPG